jgi:hypothetical protein
MALSKTQRLINLGTPPEQAKELASQMADGSMTGSAPTVADVSAAPTQADFNGLLAALRTRGVIA